MRMFDRLISSLVALSLAFLVWLYVRSRDQEMLDNVPIPVQIALAPGLDDYYELEVLGPSQVPVSFTGQGHEQDGVGDAQQVGAPAEPHERVGHLVDRLILGQNSREPARHEHDA